MTMHNIRAGEVPDLIRKTAEEIAGTFYDDPRTERFRKINMTEKAFIRKYWTKHVPDAIRSLAGLLSLAGFPEDQKETIADALFDFQKRSTSRLKPGISYRRLN